MALALARAQVPASRASARGSWQTDSGNRFGDWRIRAPERLRAGRTRASPSQQVPPPQRTPLVHQPGFGQVERRAPIPGMAICFGRPSTKAGVRTGPTTWEARILRSVANRVAGRNRQESPRKRLRETTAGRDAHTAPLGTVLLREWAPVGSAGPGCFGIRKRQESERSRARGRSCTWFAREAGFGRDDGTRLTANRSWMLTCPTVGCFGTSATRVAAIGARREQALDGTKPKEASGDASAETSACRYGLDGGTKP